MKKSRYACSLCILVLCVCFSEISAQRSRATLERRKQESLRRIAEAERILSKTHSVRKASIGQLNTINKQIDAHRSLIAALTEELQYISGEISETNQVVLALQEDLQSLGEEYARMVFWAYKNHLGINQLVFLFSSDSFRQFFLRMKYLTHYAEQRRTQLEAIQKVQQALDLQEKDLRSKRDDREKVFTEEQKRRSKLLKLKQDKETLIAQLTTRSKELRQELEAERVSIARLDALIKDLIARDAAKKTVLNPATHQRLSTSFANSHRRLRWPVQSGIISSKFGRQRHPVFKSVEQDNIGIEIQTPGSVPVSTVFEGLVSEIAIIPGMHFVVIVQHGDYRTVYARLAEVDVIKGQTLSTQQQIGKVYTSPQGSSAVHFEVWHNTKKLNPEVWLMSK